MPVNASSFGQADRKEEKAYGHKRRTRGRRRAQTVKVEENKKFERKEGWLKGKEWLSFLECLLPRERV